jgi:cytochrome c
MHECDVKPMPILLAASAGAGFVVLLTIGAVLSVARPEQDPALPQRGARQASSPVAMAQLPPAPTHLRPKDPDGDPLPTDQQLADMVRRGRNIFMETSANAGAYVGDALSCTSCHIDGGQKEGALPLVGIAAQFPAYSARI